MSPIIRLIFVFISVSVFTSCSQDEKEAISDKESPEPTHEIIAVEAESFYKQDLDEIRKWYLIDGEDSPQVERDDDPSHASTSSGGAYLEILPDTRVSHDDKLIAGENFSNKPGQLAILHYKVNVRETGRYYVWVRAHSSGSEDNGIHVGLNGEWPASGQRMQWCKGKQDWRWESKQRTKEVHCGEPWKIFLDIDKAGENEILFSMREDGFEFDKFILAKDTAFKPIDMGPAQTQE